MSQKSQLQSSRKNPSKGKTNKTSRVGGNQAVKRRHLSGYKYSPNSDIPETTPKPWYSLAVSKTSIPKEFTIADLVGFTVDQLDKDFVTFKQYSSQVGGLRIDFRLHKIEVWNLTGRAISLAVWELPAADYSAKSPGYSFGQLGGWTDAGGNDSFPRIGYVYPFATQSFAHTADWTENSADLKLITTTASNDQDSILHRFHLSWRTPGIVNYTSTIPHSPSVIDILKSARTINSTIIDQTTNDSILVEETSKLSIANHRDLTQQIEVLKKRTTKALEAIRTLCDSINSHMPNLPAEVVVGLTTLSEDIDFCDDAL